MLLILFLLMTTIPIIEIYFIIQIHQSFASFLGSGYALLITIGSIILTGLIGANLARNQGFKVMGRIQERMAQGQIPGNDMIEGLMILVGGVLLMTPGYATDLFGFAMILPGSRSLLRLWFQKTLAAKVKNGSIRVNIGSVHFHSTSRPQPNPQPMDPNVIDVEPVSESPPGNPRRPIN
ncbi:MAG: FxsA family protein [Pseudobacteriovorax sp.]|nr:FxsA family protein [Pseudobacteriovorax sp.]